jgi:hypothetical protein
MVIIAPQAILDLLDELEASRAWVFLTKKVPQSDCYLVHLNDEMIIEDLVTLPVHSYMVGMAFSIDAFASQGPVREIDHPPQLS